jgi:hypothetical protein
LPRLRVTEVFDSEERSILAVERVDTLTVEHVTGAVVSVSVQPIAVIVRDDRHVYATDMESNPVDLDRLCDQHPGLDLELAARIAAHER